MGKRRNAQTRGYHSLLSMRYRRDGSKKAGRKCEEKKRVNRTTQPIRSQSDRDAIASYFWNRSRRDYALFHFGIYTGRRISDIVQLNVGDVAYIDKRYNVSVMQRLSLGEKKTGKSVELILHPSTRRALSRYLRERLETAVSKGSLLHEPLFKSQKARRDGQMRITEQHAWRVLNQAARYCGFTYKIGTHSLRKTFGYMLHQNGVSIELIQRLLNHSSPEVTLAYIGITQEDMDEAILSI